MIHRVKSLLLLLFFYLNWRFNILLSKEKLWWNLYFFFFERVLYSTNFFKIVILFFTYFFLCKIFHHVGTIYLNIKPIHIECRWHSLVKIQNTHAQLCLDIFFREDNEINIFLYFLTDIKILGFAKEFFNALSEKYLSIFDSETYRTILFCHNNNREN